ncbi:MAG: hypothetical protein DLM73_09965 [Chthoniobacterales bacterium]|nr:MAG: hypothetical protein DLM73_09965 [Chthoniobacterales bacterium]
MRNPSDKEPDDAPPGGRAFQRIQQDRKARGLDPLPTPGTEETPESEESDTKQSPKTTKEE